MCNPLRVNVCIIRATTLSGDKRMADQEHDLEGDLAVLADQGFVCLEGLLTSDLLLEVRRGLTPFLDQGRQGRNDFEGTSTNRVYTLVARGKIFEDLVLHPYVLRIMDQLLQPNYLLTASQAIRINPGESAQPMHTDDAFCPLPRPRPPVSISTMWTIDDYTVENGATEFIAGSHKWDQETLADAYRAPGDFASERIKQNVLDKARAAVAPAGSCVVFLGTTLHRGGANRSETPRLGISNQYCEPWARPQENFFLGVPQERARQMPDRLKELLGYSVHPPFMGQLSGYHPAKALDPNFTIPVEAQEE